MPNLLQLVTFCYVCMYIHSLAKISSILVSFLHGHRNPIRQQFVANCKEQLPGCMLFACSPQICNLGRSYLHVYMGMVVVDFQVWL